MPESSSRPTRSEAEWSDDAREVMRALNSQHGEATADEIHDITGMSYDRIVKAATELHLKGDVDYPGFRVG